MPAYMTVADYRTRVGDNLLPLDDANAADGARIEKALDDGSDILRGALPRDLFDAQGAEIALGDLKPWLRSAVVPCTRLYAEYLLTDATTGNEDLLQMRKNAAENALMKVCTNADILRVIPTFETDDDGDTTDEVDLMPTTPVVTTHTNYLLASPDSTFDTHEVVASGTNTAIPIPAGTVPAGQRRFFAYARLASLGAYHYVYLYPAGHRDPQSQIAGWQDGASLSIGGVAQRLLRTRVSYSDVANGRVVEAR